MQMSGGAWHCSNCSLSTVAEPNKHRRNPCSRIQSYRSRVVHEVACFGDLSSTAELIPESRATCTRNRTRRSQKISAVVLIKIKSVDVPEITERETNLNIF